MNQGSPLSAYCLRHRVGLRLPRFPGRTNHCTVSTAGVSRQRSTYCYVPPMGARDQGLHRKHPIELSHNLTYQQILQVFEFSCFIVLPSLISWPGFPIALSASPSFRPAQQIEAVTMVSGQGRPILKSLSQVSSAGRSPGSALRRKSSVWLTYARGSSPCGASPPPERRRLPFYV